jgi:transcription-repair coupling factor (superfamily II helicase)
MKFYLNTNSKSWFYYRARRVFCSRRNRRCFSFSNDNPYRIEFFGDEVESISFDVATQLSIENKKKITIIPNVENKIFSRKSRKFLDYISEKTVIFIQNTEDLFCN